jgi:hypothetical protein
MDMKGISQSAFSSAVAYPNAGGMSSMLSEFDPSSALLRSAQGTGNGQIDPNVGRSAAAGNSGNTFQAEMAALCQQQMMQAQMAMQAHCFSPMHASSFYQHPSMHFQHALPSSFALHQHQQQQHHQQQQQTGGGGGTAQHQQHQQSQHQQTQQVGCSKKGDCGFINHGIFPYLVFFWLILSPG